MLNDNEPTRRYPLRHPDNPNLHLHYGGKRSFHDVLDLLYVPKGP